SGAVSGIQGIPSTGPADPDEPMKPGATARHPSAWKQFLNRGFPIRGDAATGFFKQPGPAP
ncbi:MAG: hypothetical protein M3414_00545, partial [Pseudomonadota bacterium]|nr:hypothetical protein [Pseudomonadota bacterium]